MHQVIAMLRAALNAAELIEFLEREGTIPPDYLAMHGALYAREAARLLAARSAAEGVEVAG